MDNVEVIGFAFILITILAETHQSILTIGNEDTNLPISEIADALIKTLGVEVESSRFKELKEKLGKVDSYVVDKDKYAALLLNETIDANLNATSFYEALKQPDSFQYLAEEKPKNLFLKMKEKMTRDDIEDIMSKNKFKDKMKSARKMAGGGGASDAEEVDEAVDDVIDKMIADAPEDDHKFKEEDLQIDLWDPQAELKERAEQVSGRRIYRGERTSVRDFPFMAAIQVMGRFWCGGVIYWRDLVLTSAACLQLMHNNRFYRENPRVLQVRIGSNHSRLGGEVIDALEVYFHPSYNPRTLANNLAVVRLRRQLYMSYHRVPKALPVARREDPPPYTAEVLLLGWGVTRSTQKLHFEPVFLQKKLLPIYPNVFCKEAYGDKFVSTKMFCAGTMSTGEGACDHDAGGPALLHGQLVGIISFGPSSCGFPNVPTVFTLVGAYADWIETVNETKPQYYTAVKSTTLLPPRVWHIVTQKNKTNRPHHRSHKKHLLKPINQLTTTSPQPRVTEPEEVTEVEEVEEVAEATLAPNVLWVPELRNGKDTMIEEGRRKKHRKRKHRS